jgi:hypothetical protein
VEIFRGKRVVFGFYVHTEDFGVPSKLKWHIFDPATELPDRSV